MMSKLTRLHDEALRLLTVYEEYKDSNDAFMRRKAHIDLDRFLMEHREVAALLFVQGLRFEINDLRVETTKQPIKRPWYRRIIKGGKVHVDTNNIKA